jgi:hypothetical protein
MNETLNARESYGGVAEQPMAETPKRAIEINSLDYGFVVRIGCQSAAVESVDKVIEKVSQYLRNPIQTEKEWYADRQKFMS